MAKATATCTCATCGGKFQREAIKRNRAEADSWTEWAERTFDECPACFGKRMREEERNTPIYAEFTLSPVSREFFFILRGNTYPFKDTAKEMGFRWMEEPPTGALGFLSTKAPPKSWVKVCKAPDVQPTAEALEKLGIEIRNKVSALDVAWMAASRKNETND